MLEEVQEMESQGHVVEQRDDYIYRREPERNIVL